MTAVTGSCVLFSGIREKSEEERDAYYEEWGDYDYYERWILESDDVTKQHLADGLKTVGITCNKDDIIIYDKHIDDGTKYCKVNFIYHPQTAEDTYELERGSFVDIFIKGLTSFSFDNITPSLEFTIRPIYIYDVSKWKF